MAHTISIAIPEPQVSFIDEQVARGEFGNRSEYFRELVRRDQLERAKARVRDLIEEGLRSGPARPWSSEDRAELEAIARGDRA